MSERLEKEVWALDKCCGCGNCIALCSKGVLFWGADGLPTLEKREKNLGLSRITLDTCSFCQKFCEEGCPRLEEEWSVLEPRRLVSARTKGIVKSGEPNDVIKHLLVAALSSGFIDGVVLADMDPWSLEPVARVATTVGEVIDTLGMQYIWVPTLSALNEAVYEKRLQNLAVVGTPCVSQGVRKLLSSDNERLSPYRQAIRLSIATFCTGIYLPELINEFLTGEMGIAQHSIKRLQALPRENLLTVLLWDGSTKTIPLNDVEKYTRSGCARCDDYLGESADIAVGPVGAKDGYCTLIARSLVGEICLRNALNFGLLEVSEEINLDALNRARDEKERRKRAQAFDKLMVMMLDALGEPKERADVKRAFVRLYENKKPAELSELRMEDASCHATCGQC